MGTTNIMSYDLIRVVTERGTVEKCVQYHAAMWFVKLLFNRINGLWVL